MKADLSLTIFRFRIVPSAIFELQKTVKKALGNALAEEMHISLEDVVEFDAVCEKVSLCFADILGSNLVLL